MEYKAKIKKLRILLLYTLAAGFFGAIISLFVLAIVGGDEPSVEQITISLIIAGLFFLIMLSSLFILIPFRKAVFSKNNIILKEFGTSESKTKTYELYYSGFEVFEQTDKGTIISINSKIINGLLFRSRISKMFFSPTGFSTNGTTSFQWQEVATLKIDKVNKRIGILLSSGHAVYLPLMKNILNLMKTFCSKEIENENNISLS